MGSDQRLVVTFLLFGLMLVCLAGCSANVSSGDGPPATDDGFMDQRATIVGPTVEGHWVSACAPKLGAATYRQFDVTFKGNTVVRNEDIYADPTCSSVPNVVNYHGRFRFIDHFSDGNYNIEYAFDVGNGVTTFPQEDLQVAGTQLLISDFAAGPVADVLTGEPLYFGQVPVTTSKPAVAVSTYNAALYAYCSNQGSGVMLDFQGTDISKIGTGTARFGTKTCGTTGDIQWASQTLNFTVTLVNGQPQISFPDATFNNYIQPSSFQSGLAGQQGAPSMIQGNSGECFFLSNDGTQNLSFAFPCN